MSEFTRVGRIDDFPDGRGRAVRVEGHLVAVFRDGDRWHAIQNHCPHMGASLADGRLEDGRVVCHMHDWRFDLETGQGDRRNTACARVYEVKVADGEVFLRSPAEPESPSAGDDDDEWVVFDPDRHLKK